MLSSHQIHPLMMTPPTLERLLYTVRRKGISGAQAVEDLMQGNPTYFISTNLTRLLAEKESRFVQWVSETKKIPYNRLFAVAYDQPLDVALWRKDYLNRYGEHDSSGAAFNSLEDWLAAERVGWAGYPNKVGGWKNQCETVDPSYFVPATLHRHVPREDVEMVLRMRDSYDRAPGEIIETFFKDPMNIAYARRDYPPTPKPQSIADTEFAGLQPTAAELETEEVRFNLDVKLVRLLQAVADYQGTTLDEVVKLFLIRGASLTVGVNPDA